MEKKLHDQEVRKRIDWIRRQQGLSQEQFARRLRISQPAVSMYLNRRIPPADVLLRMARLGNTTIEWILTGEKSYLYRPSDSDTHLSEPETPYDAEWELLHKINRLPLEVRHALHVLIDRLLSAESGAPPPDDGGNIYP